MLRKIRESMEKRDEGFTLIELLVVVIIIGILAAIAIPVFLNQRKKAWDASVKSSLKNAATSQESYFTDNNSYTMVTQDLVDEGFNVSLNVVLDLLGGDTGGFCMEGYYDADADGTSDTGNTFTYSDLTGNPVSDGGTCP